MISIMKVTGESLSPFFFQGDFVIVLHKGFFPGHLKTGDVVVFHHPVYGKLIKHVESIEKDGEALFVVGTHPESTDSRVFGTIPRRWLIGKVIFRVPGPRPSTV